MAAVNYESPAGPTYYGLRTAMVIDYLILPEGFMDDVYTTMVLRKEGRALQAMPIRAMSDHYQLLVTLPYKLEAPGAAPAQERWDHDVVPAGMYKSERKCGVRATRRGRAGRRGVVAARMAELAGRPMGGDQQRGAGGGVGHFRRRALGAPGSSGETCGGEEGAVAATAGDAARAGGVRR